MKTFVHNYRNAKAVIEQIKNGEWKCGDVYCNPYTLDRENLQLWIANGGWFCDIRGNNCFGLIFRHWVWFAGVKPFLKNKKEEGRLKLY